MPSWFDVFNSQRRWHKSKKAKYAFGEYLELQTKILKDFSYVIGHMLVEGHTKLIDFQRGIITSSNALPMLYEQLVVEYGVKLELQHIYCLVKDRECA